jgi:hypothetical protein
MNLTDERLIEIAKFLGDDVICDMYDDHPPQLYLFGEIKDRDGLNDYFLSPDGMWRIMDRLIAKKAYPEFMPPFARSYDACVVCIKAIFPTTGYLGGIYGVGRDNKTALLNALLQYLDIFTDQNES